MSILQKEDFVNITLLKKSKTTLDINDFFDAHCLFMSNEASLLLTLKTMFDDKEDWIEYYCFELNYGKTYTKGDIIDADGNDIVLSTPEQLYDFLIKQYNIFE